MNSFIIKSEPNWYTESKTNQRKKGVFLNQSIEAFYHDDYHVGDIERRETPGTVENIITTLKNTFKSKPIDVLKQAGYNLIEILKTDLPQILQKTRKNNLVICVVPRAKKLADYTPTQLFFRQAISYFAKNTNGFSDGTDYIIRHTDTVTTHLHRSGRGGDGEEPYPGITKNTCTISENVKGKDILLVDDLYTMGVNIDEDAIQTLLDNGANSVVFYSLGKTVKSDDKSFRDL